jgi:hypothetical protein
VPLYIRRDRPSVWPGGFAVAAATGVPPLIFDASIREQHGAQWVATSVPIEGGARVTDHVQPQPVPLVMDVGLTDTPALYVKPQPSRAKTLYGQLLAIAATRQPMDVLTSLRIYTSMVITSISVPRSGDSGDALICTVTWQEIEIATVDQAAVLADAAIAFSLGSQNLGNLQPQTDQQVPGVTLPGPRVI